MPSRSTVIEYEDPAALAAQVKPGDAIEVVIGGSEDWVWQDRGVPGWEFTAEFMSVETLPIPDYSEAREDPEDPIDLRALQVRLSPLEMDADGIEIPWGCIERVRSFWP